ncbi:MAG: M14 family zinc carboxypeptidase [Thermoplasmatota archaeon]
MRSSGVSLTGKKAILLLSLLSVLILVVSGGRAGPVKGGSDGDPPGLSGIDPSHTLNSESNFTEYFDYNSMTEYLQFLEETYTDLVRLWSIGTTHEGREIWCVKLSDSPGLQEDGNPGSEPQALLVGAHHGNEWISYEVPLYVIKFLLDNYGGEDRNGSIASFILENRELFIVPMLNPDGVQYAHEQERGWRKNREPNYISDFSPKKIVSPDAVPVSYGVDINRNYGWMWHVSGGSNVLLSSGSSYRGPPDNLDDDGDAVFQIDITPGILPNGPDEGVDEDPWDGIDNDGDGKVDEDPSGGFTSLETIAMRSLGETYDFPVAITYHSYSRLVLWPWGYTNEPAPDGPVLAQLGTRMAEMNGYTPMQGYDLYKVSGEFNDWFYAQYGTFGYTFEVGDRHTIPGEEIREHCELNLEPSLYLVHAAHNPYESYVRFDENSTSHTIRRNSIDISFSGEIDQYPIPWDLDRSAMVYRWDGGLWQRASIKMDDDGNLSTSVGRPREGGKLDYYLELRDSSGRTVTEPLFAPNELFTIDLSKDSIFSVYFGLDTILIMLFTLGTSWGGFTLGIVKAVRSDKGGRPVGI